jgi:hypothetical protein
VIETGLLQGSFLRADEACMSVPGFAEWSLAVVADDGVVWIADDDMLASSDWMAGDARRRERLPI